LFLGGPRDNIKINVKHISRSRFISSISPLYSKFENPKIIKEGNLVNLRARSLVPAIYLKIFLVALR